MGDIADMGMGCGSMVAMPIMLEEGPKGLASLLPTEPEAAEELLTQEDS